MSDSIQRVAIVGGGFSGAMLAARLAEQGVASTVIDRSGEFGPGVAYSTTFDGHVLNVRSNRMSAVEDRPDDFVRWLEARHPDQADPDGFAPRRLYGLYLRDRLARVEAAYPGRILRETGEAVAIEDKAVRLLKGRRVEADAVVLATGNPAPGTANAAGEAIDRVIGDPWAPGALARIGQDDDVIILGSGLTMVDVVLWLAANGWKGKAVALSRRGLTPRAHGDRSDPPLAPSPPLMTGPLSGRLAEARRQAAAGGWRGVMEGLRPVTARLWAEADPADRARFLRHLRPWWDAHRHRLAAPVESTLAALRAEGRLRIVAGRIRKVGPESGGVRVEWRRRAEGDAPPLAARWLIDCTGPAHDPVSVPIVESLIQAGEARLDPLGFGLDLDADGRAVRGDGGPGRLFVLGPPAQAAYWETTAVPDIRKRIESLVAVLHGRLEKTA